jgi:hypothetical protein
MVDEKYNENDKNDILMDNTLLEAVECKKREVSMLNLK